jgi:sugar porter (SP) family MFS transporter
MFNWRIVVLTIVASLGGLLFGFDTGVVGGIVAMQTFKDDYGLTPENESAIQGNCVALLQAGCFFGVITMAFITDKLGRKKAIIGASIIFCIGGVLQTAASGILGLFYAGRVVSGLGVGAASMLTPTFISEMAPKEIRGKLLTGYSCVLFFGVALSYWVNYACQQTLSGSNQYLVPIAFQLVPGGLLGLGIIPLKESPRWLVKKDRRNKALENLRYIRTGDHTEDEILEEFAEMCDVADMEASETNGVTFKEVFLPGNRGRFIIAISIMICQQFTGTNAFSYYAPILFQKVGLSGESAGLFATGLYGVVKTIFSIISMLFLIERVGRKWSLLVGGFVMGSALLIVAIVYVTHPPKDGTDPSQYSYAMIVMIYIYCVAYSGSWGPVPWTYCAEIFPNRLREYGVTAGTATQWAFNFMISKVVPIGIENLGWRIFLMFAIFNYAFLVYTFFFIKETKGKSLRRWRNSLGLQQQSTLKIPTNVQLESLPKPKNKEMPMLNVPNVFYVLNYFINLCMEHYSGGMPPDPLSPLRGV